jgi:hypothetical protein
MRWGGGHARYPFSVLEASHCRGVSDIWNAGDSRRGLELWWVGKKIARLSSWQIEC